MTNTTMPYIAKAGSHTVQFLCHDLFTDYDI